MNLNDNDQLTEQYGQYIEMTDMIFDINEESFKVLSEKINQCKEIYSIGNKQILRIIICASKYRESRLKLYFNLIISYFNQEFIKSNQEIITENKTLKDALEKYYKFDMNDPKRNQNIDIEKILNKFNKIPIKYFVNDDVNGFLEYVNNKSSQFNPNATHAHKSYLNYCAMLGSVSCFKSLILKDAKVDNYTLEYASIGGDFEIFQIVEQKIGENPEIISNSLLKAIQCHNDEIAYYLIDKYSAEFPFLRCAECYNMKFFIYKLGNNETINDRDDFESTALRASIHFEIPSFVSYLCNFKDIDLDLNDNQKETPLMISSILGNTEIAKILIEKGADLNLKSDLGYSALMYCSLYNSISVTKLLIQHSALKHLYKDSGSKRMNAKDIAAESGHQEIVDLLK